MTQPWNIVAIALIIAVTTAGVLAQLPPEAAQIGVRALAIGLASTILMIYWPFMSVALADVRNRLRGDGEASALRSYHLLGLGLIFLAVGLALPYARNALVPVVCASGTVCYRVVQMGQVLAHVQPGDGTTLG